MCILTKETLNTQVLGLRVIWIFWVFSVFSNYRNYCLIISSNLPPSHLSTLSSLLLALCWILLYPYCEVQGTCLHLDLAWTKQHPTQLTTFLCFWTLLVFLIPLGLLPLLGSSSSDYPDLVAFTRILFLSPLLILSRCSHSFSSLCSSSHITCLSESQPGGLTSISNLNCTLNVLLSLPLPSNYSTPFLSPLWADGTSI